MFKIIEALAIFFLTRLNQAAPGNHGINPSKIVSEFLAKKGRLMALSFMTAVSLAILMASGIVLMVVGGAQWIADDGNSVAHNFVFFGLGLSLAAGFLGSWAFSKKRFEIVPEEEDEKPKQEVAPAPPAGQIIEEVILAVIKEFMKSKKPEEKESQSTPTAASSTPTSVHTA